jgi:hypothetical protein
MLTGMAFADRLAEVEEIDIDQFALIAGLWYTHVASSFSTGRNGYLPIAAFFMPPRVERWP